MSFRTKHGNAGRHLVPCDYNCSLGREHGKGWQLRGRACSLSSHIQVGLGRTPFWRGTDGQRGQHLAKWASGLSEHKVPSSSHLG